MAVADVSTTPVPRRLRSGTHAVIDLDAFRRNIALLRALTPPNTAFMAVLKADGYGHGSVTLAHEAQIAGASWIGVARFTEALLLRQNGVSLPILIIGPTPEDDIPAAIETDITLSVGTGVAIDAAGRAAQTAGSSVRVHLKLDTGMHRNGVLPEDALAAARRIVEHPFLELDGLFTHYSSADEVDPLPTDDQIKRFDQARQSLAEAGIEPRYLHLANSAAVIAGRIGPSNLIRCGIALHGLSPSPEVPVDERFQSTLSLRSTIQRRFTLAPGEGVSYGLTWRAEQPTELGLVPVGYADGIPRNLANIGWFITGGVRCPIRGRVCMDQTVIEVPEGCQEGDTVLIVGDGRAGEMTFDSVAELVGTNNYELATRIMARVPRLYEREGSTVSWEVPLTSERGSLD